MSFRHLIRGVFITLLAVLTALPFLAAPVNAAPNSAPAPRAEVQRGAHDVTVTVFDANVSVKDGALVLSNKSGKVLETIPLTYVGKGARNYPIDAKVKGNVAKLVPSTDVKRSTAPVALGKVDVADRDGYRSKAERDSAALGRLQQELSASMTIGSLVGTAIGIVLGFIIGCAGGIPVGCLPTAVAVATVGGVIGSVIGGGGASIGAVQRYFSTINRPFKNVKPNN